ncbi:hypothetical protein QFC21_002765 [Naganishia friedmannii]|uniref:Uncharacterized protein n=1 Tax=Naganishia friedmannii TaxID=89922 RepID=A0ACC2VTF1_9TREE|nr:hypothetical protein QFC21_002765 [Naganishia friedmannii]
MPYRRFLREQNIYVPSNINPNLQSPPPPTQGQVYQSPPPQVQVYQTPSPQYQVYHSPPGQFQPGQSPPAQVQLYHSPPQQVHYYSPTQQSPQQLQPQQFQAQSPQQLQQQQQFQSQSPQQLQQQFQPQQVDMPVNYHQPATGIYSPHGVGQPLPPGVLGRAPRNGNIVQQHTHYPFAPQQQNVPIPIQPQIPSQQGIPVLAQQQVQRRSVSNIQQQPTPAKKRKLTADQAVAGHAQGSESVEAAEHGGPPNGQSRPSFDHRPGSSSSVVSEDPGAMGSSSIPIRNERDTHQQQQVSEDGKKLVQKKAKTGSSRGPREKHKAKACIYCRRSHMVCDHERPCARCIKRGIEHLCIEDGLHQTASSSARAQASGHESEDLGKRSHSPAERSTRRKRAKSSSSGTNGQDVAKSDATAQQNPLDFWPANQETRGSGSQGDSRESMSSLVPQGISPASLNARVNLYNMSGAEGTAGASNGGNLHSTGLPLPPAWPMLPGDATAAEKIDGHLSHLKGNPTLSSGPSMDLAWPTTDGAPTERDAVDDMAGGNNGSGTYTGGVPSVNEPLHGSRTTDLPPQATVTNYGTTATERLSRQVQGGEFGVLSDFLESLGIPSLPGGLGDIFGDNRLDLAGLGSTAGMGGMMGDAFGVVGLGDAESTGQDRPLVEVEQGNADAGVGAVKVEEDGLNQPILPKASKAEKYFLAAADQASGTRDERLAKVIKAKYEAGLLKPYDYSRGYAKMYKWLEKNVPSPATRQAILRPLSVFRPAFRAISQTLSDIDLVFVEEAFERLMLDYDRVFSAIHTPACLWRRTGEIYKANKEFSVLTGIPSALLRGGKIGIYELMTEESMVQYYQAFGSIAFDSGRKSLHTACTLRIPEHLTRVSASSTTPLLGPAAYSSANTPLSSPKPSNLALPASLMMTRTESQPGSATPNQARVNTAVGADDVVRTVKCCFSFTIRRDSYGFPTAIVGNFIPS